jgi:hypothetical protein
MKPELELEAPEKAQKIKQFALQVALAIEGDWAYPT